MGANERQSIELTCKFCIKPLFGSVYIKEAKCDNDEIVQIDF